MEDVPVIVCSSHLSSNGFARLTTQVCIGDQAHVLKLPNRDGFVSSVAQWVVVDLRDLSVPATFDGRFLSKVPEAVAKYAGQNEFLLVFTTNAQARTIVPEGDVLELFQKIGAGDKLQRLVHIVSHMDDRPMPPDDLPARVYSYILAVTLGFNDDRGLEKLSFTEAQILDFKLQWNDVLKRYVPVAHPGLTQQPEK